MASIALVDGREGTRDLLEDTLSRRGHMVVALKSKLHGESLVDDPPELLIIAAELPDGSGLELVARIRRQHLAEKLPILVLCEGGEQDYLRAYAAGASDCVSRSASFEVLLAKCAHLVKQSRLRAPAPKRLLPLPGETLFERYELSGLLGQGSYGAVYSAVDLRDRSSVALKIMLESSEVDAEGRERFLREVYTLASLDSPRIVKVLDFGKRDGYSYCVMERVVGTTLLDRVADDGPCEEAELRVLLAGLAEGLVALEEVGLLHRDLKPANVMLRFGRPKEPVLVDFGLAKVPFDGAVTAPDVIMGTPGYLAPEILQGPGDVRSDLFALGQIIAYAGRGAEPWPSLIGYKLVLRMAQEQVELPTVSEELTEVLDRLTRLDPDERYSSAGALVQRLQELGIS